MNEVLKKIYIVGLVSVSAYGVYAADEASDNLLKNPGFEIEKPKGKFDVANKWRLYFKKPKQLNEEGVKITLDDKVFHGGAKSLKIESLENAVPVSVAQVNVPAEEGKTYELSAWAKAECDFPGKLPIRINFWMDGEFKVKDKVRKLKAKIKVFEATGEWKQFKYTYTVPKGMKKTQIILEFRNKKGKGVPGIVWFDDIALKEIKAE